MAHMGNLAKNCWATQCASWCAGFVVFRPAFHPDDVFLQFFTKDPMLFDKFALGGGGQALHAIQGLHLAQFGSSNPKQSKHHPNIGGRGHVQ